MNMSVPLLTPRRGVRAAAAVTFAAAMATCALVAVVFSGADRGDALLQLAATGAGGYALPPGYEASGKDLETRDHSRWWEHGSVPSQQRKPAAPAPAPAEPRAVQTDRLPKEMLDAMVSSSV